MKKPNVNTSIIQQFIKRYESAVLTKNKDIRISTEEASQLITSLVGLMSFYLEENMNQKENKEEVFSISLDLGTFKKLS